MKPSIYNPRLVLLVLRIGISFAFFYAAIASILHPTEWTAFLPSYMTTIIPATTLLLILSIYQIILAIWLIIGWKILYAAVLSALTILGIIAANLSAFDITFRDVTIFFAAAALPLIAAVPVKAKCALVDLASPD